MTLNEKTEYASVLRREQSKILGTLPGREEIVVEKASDAIDEVQQMGERELALRALDRDSGTLRLIGGALSRLRDGSYGTCLHCETEIPAKRLAAVPWAAYCVRCQEKVDRREVEDFNDSGWLEPAA